MTELPMMLGSTLGSVLSWRWDRSHMRFEATHGDHKLRVHFHKLGGRWSRMLPDGTQNPNPPPSYWTAEVDGDHPHRCAEHRYKTAREAQLAAVAEFKRRYGKVD